MSVQEDSENMEFAIDFNQERKKGGTFHQKDELEPHQHDMRLDSLAIEEGDNLSEKTLNEHYDNKTHEQLLKMRSEIKSAEKNKKKEIEEKLNQNSQPFIARFLLSPI